MVDAALQFDPDYSEAHYLRARVFLRDQESTLDAIRSLERALSLSQWSETDPDDATRLLAGTLVRCGRAGSAIAPLADLAARHPENPSDALLLIRAYERAGDLAAERTALQAASRRFPRDVAFALYRIDGMIGRGELPMAGEELRRALTWAPGDTELLLRRARMEEEPGRRRSYVDAYIAKGGTDPGASNLALSADPADPAPYVKFFLSHAGWTDWEASDRFLSLLCAWPKALEEAEAALAGWSGSMDLDRNRDGFYEERRVYMSGVPVRWIADADQDGVAEFVAELENGTPRSLLERKASRETWKFLYEPYPFIGGAEDLSRGGRCLYRIQPFLLGIPILDGEEAGTGPEAPRPVPMPPDTVQVLSAAFQLEEYAEGSELPLRRTELLGGHPAYREEDTDGDGKPDRRIWFSKGLPVSGSRDPASDGTFPVAERYRDGELAGIDVDTDGDGKPDFTEEYDGGVPVLRSWDYNRDGIFDAREHVERDGLTVREFATGRDGVFNLATTFHGGTLVEVRENGKTLAVGPDPATGILWIGSRRDASGLDTNREGFQSVGGRTYLIFRFKDRTYAEELP